MGFIIEHEKPSKREVIEGLSWPIYIETITHELGFKFTEPQTRRLRG